MLDFIKGIFQFQHKVDSLQEFVWLAREVGCASAVIKPHCVRRTSKRVGFASFQYILEFSAKTPRGSKIMYREPLFWCFGRKGDAADFQERRDRSIRVLLVGEKRLKELREKLPGISVELIGWHRKPMDEKACNELHRDAAARGISV